MDKRKYELAKELFVKRSRTEYLTDKTVTHFQSIAKDAIALAELFIDEFNKHEEKKDEQPKSE